MCPVPSGPTPTEPFIGHPGPVKAVAFAGPDRLVTGGEDGTILVHDLATGEPVVAFAAHDGPVLAMAVSPDHRELVTSSNDGFVYVWNLADGARRAVFVNHEGASFDACGAVAISPDGTQLLTGSTSGIGGRVFTMDGATLRNVLFLDDSGADAHGGVAITASGERMFVGGADGRISVWDGRTLGFEKVISTYGGYIDALAVTPDGSELFTLRWPDGPVRIWDPVRGTELATLQEGPPAQRVRALTLSPDGSTVVTGTEDGVVWVWDRAARAAVHELRGHRDEVHALAVSPDGRLLASGSEDGTAVVWDLATGERLAAFGGHGGARIDHLAVTPDGATLVSLDGAACETRVWNIDDGSLRFATRPEPGGSGCIALTPDNGEVLLGTENRVEAWDLGAGTLRARFPVHEGWFRAVVALPDGATVAAAGLMVPIVRVFDRQTGEVAATLPVECQAMAASPDGKYLVLGLKTGGVDVYQVGEWAAPCRSIHHKGEGWVDALCVSSSGLLVIGQADLLACADLATGEIRWMKPKARRWIKTLALAPNGTTLFVGYTGGQIACHDLATGELRGKLTGHTGQVWSLAALPDGSGLVSGSTDGSIRMWRLDE